MWIKKLRQRKLQTAIIFIIVLVCSMLMTSSMVIMTSLNKPYQDLIRECNSPELKIYPFDMPAYQLEQVRERLEALDSTEKAAIIKYHFLTEKITYNNKVLEGFFDLGEYKEDINGHYRVISGDLREPRENECIISAVFANENNIKTSDSIFISDMDAQIEYKVIAVYTEPYNMNLAYNNAIFVRSIPEQFNVEKYISVYGKADTKGIEIVNEYREKNDGVLEGREETLEVRVSNNAITEKILGGILLGISFLILIVSCVMIRYMIRNALLCDKKIIAIYKTIGYSNNDMIYMYLKIYIFIVAAGSIAGAAASFLISDGFIVQAFKNMGEVKKSGTLIPGIICVLIISGFVMLQVYSILRKMKDMKPVVILNGKEADLGKLKTKRYSFSEKFSFSPLGIGVRMLQRDKKNTGYIILTCIVSIYCVNFALSCFTILQSMKDNNYYWIGFDKHDVSVSAISADRYLTVIEELRNEPETERAILTVNDINVMLPWKKGMGDTIIPAMVYETYDKIDMPLIEGRNPKYSNEIVISGLVAKELKKGIGDYLDVYLDIDKKVSLLITGTYQSYYNMGRGCRLLGSTLTENGVNLNYTEASVYLKKKTDKQAYIEKYSSKYKGNLDILDRKDRYGSIMSMIRDPQIKAIAPFMILTLLLGALNITAIVYLKNNDNKKVNSIYKCIGYTSVHLIQANLFYTGIVAVVSMVITLPLFIGIFPKTMVLCLSVFGFEKYLVNYNLPFMLIGNFTIMLIFLISTLLSSCTLNANQISELNQE